MNTKSQTKNNPKYQFEVIENRLNIIKHQYQHLRHFPQ